MVSGKRLLTFLLLLTAVSSVRAVSADDAVAAPPHTPQVLLLLSYEPMFPIAQQIVRAVGDGFSSAHPDPVTLHVEYMDADFSGSQDYLRSYRQLLQDKEQINGEHFDLVMTAGDAALQLMAEEGRPFPGTPVVFLAAENADLIRDLRMKGGITGIYESLPVYEYIALMRYLYPGFTRLHVITDGSPGREPRLQLIRQAASSLNEELQLHSLASQSWEELGEALAAVDRQPLLLLSARADREGERRPFQQAVNFIAAHAQSPVWHLWPHGIGQGLAGGVVVDIDRSARRATELAALVLSGVSPDDLAVEWHGDHLTMADTAVLEGFGIAADNLPVDAVLLNSQAGFWETYRSLIALAVSVAVLLLAAVMLFWSEMRRRRLSDAQLDERTELMKNVLDSIPDLVFYKDLQGRYVFCNVRFSSFFGADPVGKTDYELFDQDTADFFRQKDNDALARKAVSRNEEWVYGVDGSALLLETQKTPIFDKSGELVGVFGLSRDITELKKAQENLEHIAHHDVLTGLPNRLLLNKKLEYALQISRRRGDSLAVIFLDLDRFKDINDTIGHDIGDLLLKDVAHRLHNNVRDSDICSRLGGDEFVVVLTQVDSVEKIQEKCDQLLQVISMPYSLQGHLLSVFASAGISIYPQHGTTVDELIRNADAALHKAKELGRNRYCHYERELTDSIHSRMSLEQDLRSALESHEFTLNYQPQFRTGEKQPRRVEALLRWPHPVRGMISPLEFIPLAETSGMIIEIGYWVVKSACQQFLFWREQGLMLEKLAVNVSAVQINASFADTIAGIMEHLSFDPRWLELEVTESLMMSGTTEVSQQIQQLRTMGVEFAIDDFGTGYSSLSKIKSMPVTVVKIDQSFIRDINDDVNDYEIVRAIVLMSKSLGLTVVAEGVENQEQERTLQRIGCEWVQGYYYARPVSGEELYLMYREQ